MAKDESRSICETKTKLNESLWPVQETTKKHETETDWDSRKNGERESDEMCVFAKCGVSR